MDDRHFADLLDRYHACEGDEKRALEQEIVTGLDQHLRRALRPLLEKRFPAAAADTSVRYTTMVNDFFAKVLDRRPDGFWRARTLLDLRRWSSRVISNQIVEVLRRSSRRSDPEGPLEELADQREQHFRAQHALDLGDALQKIERWESRAEPWPERAQVLRHRYVDGMPYPEIAQQLGIEVKLVYRRKEEAVEALRKELA